MGIAEGYAARTQRLQVDELRKQREAELAQKGYQYDQAGNLTMTPGGAAEVEQAKNNEALQLAQSLQARLAASDTDNAIGDYVHSGDASYLQRALDNNPMLKGAWAKRGVQLVQNIDWGNDNKLLSSVGISPNMYDSQEKQDQLKKGLYKYYDGKEYHIGYINNLIAQTGAMSRMGADRASMIMEHMQGIANSIKGSSNAMEQQKVSIDQQNADTNVMNAKTNQANAATNRQSAVWSHQDNIAQLNQRREEAYIKLQTEGQTANQKDLQAADNLTGSMLKDFGSTRENTNAFFNTDFSKRENFEKGYRYISKIEKLEGTTLSADDKKKISETRQLIASATGASKLGDSDTGIIDNKFNDVNKYLQDNLKGTEARASWYAFRNMTRKIMSGQSLTASEIEASTQALGDLREKKGQVLAKFKTSLLQVKADLDGMNTVMNPYSVKIRLGADQKQLDTIIGNIDKTLQYMDGAGSKQTVTKHTPSLADFFTPIAMQK